MANMNVIAPSSDFAGVTWEANKQEDGTDLAWAVNATHRFVNNGKTMLNVTTGAGVNTMTVLTTAQQFGLGIKNRVISLNASTAEVYGPFPSAAHNDADGYADVRFSSVTGLEIIAYTV